MAFKKAKVDSSLSLPAPFQDRAKENIIQSTLPSQLTGMKLELAGRLTTQRSIPRKTVENKSIGLFSSFPSSQLVENGKLDLSRYESKNKIGAYTIKV